jgi:hypothetical protein
MIRTPILALALALAAGATRAGDLNGLVDRYVAWRGGPAFEGLQTIHERGTVDASGLHGTDQVWSSRDGRQRVDIDLGALKQVQVITPAAEQSWDTNLSAQVETTAKTVAEFERHALVLEFADVLRGHAGAKASLLGVEQRDGATWSVVRLSFGGADTYDAFIDPATGALDGFRITEDRQTRFEHRSDWRIVDGVRMPFENEVKTDVAGGDQTLRFEAIELNRPFPDTLLVRPAIAHKASFRDGASSTGWIPFEFFGGNRIYFPAKVNGHDIVVLLDSGAQTSVIDKTVARSIGLDSKGGGVTVLGSGGAETAGVINGLTVEVGNLKLSGLTVVSLDLQSHAGQIGHSLPFVLGDELFSEVAVDIDFANRRIAFRDPARIARPQGAAEVPLATVLSLRSIPVSIDGGPPVQVDFDLGSGLPLMVYPSYYKTHALLDGRRTSQSLIDGAGGREPQTVAMLRKLELAGVTFTDVPTIFTPDTVSAANSDRLLGNVGLPILSRFHLVIDYSHDRLWLTPDAQTSGAPFPKDRLGLWLDAKDGALVIAFVAPGSPAQAAGLEAGQRIATIDGKPASAWPADARRALAAQAAGTAVDLTLEDRRVLHVALADYF